MIADGDMPLAFGSTLLPVAPTLLAGLGFTVLAIWYWRRLGRGSVPKPRRVCRRWGLIFGVIAIAAIFLGASVFDSERSPAGFLASWAVVGMAVLAVTITAALDVLLTTLLYRESLQRHILRDAQQLRNAIDGRESIHGE